ncbi:type II toxin-antitoxin system RelE/ParE family toxin [Xylanibacter rodentium]|uniref:type II toxin-antitoxin system RelE/ParE family toxin n=2 Tax=Bacteroidales TaxID=171549 RepID=UPI00397C9A35
MLYEYFCLTLHKILIIWITETPLRFNVVYLEEAINFITSLDEKVRAKIAYNIFVSQHENNAELFKKLNDCIWEFRTNYKGMAYRLFAFWDKESRSMVVATHGLIKKSQKTPPKEIRRAEELMKMYYASKQE